MKKEYTTTEGRVWELLDFWRSNFSRKSNKDATELHVDYDKRQVTVTFRDGTKALLTKWE